MIIKNNSKTQLVFQTSSGPLVIGSGDTVNCTNQQINEISKYLPHWPQLVVLAEEEAKTTASGPEVAPPPPENAPLPKLEELVEVKVAKKVASKSSRKKLPKRDDLDEAGI